MSTRRLEDGDKNSTPLMKGIRPSSEVDADDLGRSSKWLYAPQWQAGIIRGVNKYLRCFGFFRFLAILFHFIDKPPVVTFTKAVLFGMDFSPLDVLKYCFIVNTCKMLGNVLKTTTRVPRPLWVYSNLVENVKSVSERSFSFPSCHLVYLSSFTLVVALAFPHSAWAWVSFGGLSAGMALSRVILAMHWPQDVLGALNEAAVQQCRHDPLHFVR